MMLAALASGFPGSADAAPVGPLPVLAAVLGAVPPEPVEDGDCTPEPTDGRLFEPGEGAREAEGPTGSPWGVSRAGIELTGFGAPLV